MIDINMITKTLTDGSRVYDVEVKGRMHVVSQSEAIRFASLLQDLIHESTVDHSDTRYTYEVE